MKLCADTKKQETSTKLNVMDQVQMQAFVPNELIRHQTGIALTQIPDKDCCRKRQGITAENTV